MLYAGSCLSELPISTTRTEIPNGDEYGFSFIIDQILDGEYEIDQILDSVYIIDQALENSHLIDPVISFTLSIKPGDHFTLDGANE